MKKQIVFIEGYSTVMIYKIAKLFKEKGYETVLIRLLEPNSSDKDFYNDAFNKIIDLNISFVKISLKNFFLILFNLLKNTKNIISALTKIQKLKPYIIFGRANPNSPIAFFRILFRKTPLIYFPYDIRVHYTPTKKLAKKERNLSSIEIWAEKFNFENSDAILHKGAPYELNYIHNRYLGKKLKLPQHTITFHPYCSKEFIIPLNKNKLSKVDREIHLVCIGTSGKKTHEVYELFFETAKHIINQEIHFYVYVSSKTKSREDSVKSFLNKYKNFPNIKYFHIHKSKNPKKIVKELSKYDFAISFPPINVPKYNLDPKFAVGNREATFFEAGIPHFYPYNVEYTGKIMKKYNINLPITLNGLNDFNDIRNLKKRIKKLNYKQLEKNILKAREDFLMEKHFPRLEKFVKDVAEFKRRKEQNFDRYPQ